MEASKSSEPTTSCHALPGACRPAPTPTATSMSCATGASSAWGRRRHRLPGFIRRSTPTSRRAAHRTPRQRRRHPDRGNGLRRGDRQTPPARDRRCRSVPRRGRRACRRCRPCSRATSCPAAGTPRRRATPRRAVARNRARQQCASADSRSSIAAHRRPRARRLGPPGRLIAPNALRTFSPPTVELQIQPPLGRGVRS